MMMGSPTKVLVFKKTYGNIKSVTPIAGNGIPIGVDIAELFVKCYKNIDGFMLLDSNTKKIKWIMLEEAQKFWLELKDDYLFHPDVPRPFFSDKVFMVKIIEFQLKGLTKGHETK